MALILKEGMVRKVDENASQCLAQPRILVVDDDHLSVQVVTRMMGVLGSKVDAANGGLAVLNCLSRERYDVVITDLEMPGLSGYELACWLKEKSGDTKVIIMTGRNRFEVANFMKSGMVDCWLFKPFSISDLETTLSNIMQLGLEE